MKVQQAAPYVNKMACIRFTLLADTHLGFDYPLKPRITRRRRGYDFFNNFDKILQLAKENHSDLVIHGGDFFFRSKVPQGIVQIAYDKLLQFADSGIPFVIVPGNHERSRLPGSLFLGHPNIHIFDTMKTLRFTIRNQKVALAGFPFIRHNIRDQFNNILQELRKEQTETIRILCMHQAVQGAKVGPSDYTFRYGPDVIRMRDIPMDLHAVFCGHIHRQQILWKTDEQSSIRIPVIYPGSIERTSFAEKYEDKGFYTIDICSEDGKQWQMNELEFVTLPARPMVDLYLDGQVTPENIISVLKKQIKEIDSNSIVRIRLSEDFNEQARSMLTGAFLRDILPDSMNYQFSGDFMQRTYRKRK